MWSSGTDKALHEDMLMPSSSQQLCRKFPGILVGCDLARRQKCTHIAKHFTSKGKGSFTGFEQWWNHSWCAVLGSQQRTSADIREGVQWKVPCDGWNTGHMQEVEFNELIRPGEEEGKGRPGCGYCLVQSYKFCSGMHSNRLRGNMHMLEWGKLH